MLQKIFACDTSSAGGSFLAQNDCGCSAGPTFEPFQDGGGGGPGWLLGLIVFDFFCFGWDFQVPGFFSGLFWAPVASSMRFWALGVYSGLFLAPGAFNSIQINPISSNSIQRHSKNSGCRVFRFISVSLPLNLIKNHFCS